MGILQVTKEIVSSTPKEGIDVVPFFTYSGATTAVVAGGYGINTWLAIGGFSIAIASLMVNVWFNKQHLNLALRDHKRRSDDQDE